MNISTLNRNESYKSIMDSLPKRRLKIYEYIQKHQPVSPQEVCEIYQMKFNEVAPRFTELHQSGFIKEVGEKINNRSKKPNTAYSCTTIDEIAIIRRNMSIELSEEFNKITKDLLNYEDVLSVFSKNILHKRAKTIIQQMKKIKNHE